MKILYICSDAGIPVLGRKGASVHVRSLATAFTDAGHSVVLATPLLTKSPWEAPAPFGAQIMHVPASESTVDAIDSVRGYVDAIGAAASLPGEVRRILYNQQLEAKLLRRFEQAPPDFVYERAALYSTAGVTVARALQVPLVVELNAPPSLEQSTYRESSLPALAQQAERRTLAGADIVLAVSSPLRDYVVGLGVAPERVVVVPNAIDPKLFTPGAASAATRARWRIGEGPVLGFVGGLRPWHGVRALPALLERLSRRHPSIQMIIAGDGPLRDELSRACGDLGLSDRVVFTGALAHEEVAEVVRLFDIAVAPYDQADHLFYFSPLKLFEYMGCGAPVVAAAVGQIADVVRDGDNGLLYPPGDAGAMAAACERLLGDPALRERLGRAAARLVHDRYTWSANARSVVELVQGLRVPAEVCA